MLHSLKTKTLNNMDSMIKRRRRNSTILNNIKPHPRQFSGEVQYLSKQINPYCFMALARVELATLGL